MADPAVVSMNTEWEWVKIASGITVGSVHMVNRMPCYYRTYRVTGEDAPSNPSVGTMPDEAIRIFLDTTEEKIRANQLIDVYLLCVNHDLINKDTGKVVVDA